MPFGDNGKHDGLGQDWRQDAGAPVARQGQYQRFLVTVNEITSKWAVCTKQISPDQATS